MKQATILNILCEGQTEQQFAEKVLKPYLQDKGINSVKTTILFTNKKESIQGGIISYEQVKRDLRLLYRSHKDDLYTRNVFTTMFDLYALPNDFPGYKKANTVADKYQQVEQLEQKFAEDVAKILEVDVPNTFIPYIQLHEFEALVFCGIDYLADLYPKVEKAVEELKKVLDKYNGNPELINNSPTTAPSKRLELAISKCKHHYTKPRTGSYVTGRTGIETLRKRCFHFNQWIEQIVNLLATDKI